MRSGRAMFAIGLAAVVVSTGCVDRRFIIESNVPNAQVYIDNKPVGAAPADAPFDYYGYYNVTLVHPNFAPLHKRVRVRPPWYAYPPFDFVAEVLWPLRIEDTRRYFFEMNQPLAVPQNELSEKADLLRQRGWALPTPAPTYGAQASPNLLGVATPPDPTLPPVGVPSAMPIPEAPVGKPR